MIDAHGGWPALLTDLLDRNHLTADQAHAAMATILSGDATPAQVIGFAVALRAKGESAEELSGLLDAVLEHATLVPLSDEQRASTVDIVGTVSEGPVLVASLVVGSPRVASVEALHAASTTPTDRARTTGCHTRRFSSMRSARLRRELQDRCGPPLD